MNKLKPKNNNSNSSINFYIINSNFIIANNKTQPKKFLSKPNITSTFRTNKNFNLMH